jgi:hypothetical protein
MASSLRGYLRQLRLVQLSQLRPWLTRGCRLGAMDHGCAPFVTAVSVFLRHAARVRSRLCGLLRLLEPNRQPVPVRPVLDPVRPIDQRSGDSLEPELEEQAMIEIRAAGRKHGLGNRGRSRSGGHRRRMVDLP